METSQPISIESFSYSWLVNMKPSLEACVDASDEASSFIEMDPRNPPSKRFFQRNSQEFKFDFPVSQSPLALVHADELFSNGYLTPLFAESLKMESYSDSVSSTSNLVLPSSSPSSSINSMGPKAQASRCSSLKRCRTLSRRMFQKYLNFLRPLCKRLRGRHQKSGSNHEGAGKRGFYETSPRISVAYSADDWRKSCDSESSIYEAVLHCKRSIERT
ncbi:probable membrane-associated kinase regulator 6 [Neltuma alba]|uniref:probable membrane-associated kinase regulator 6 n=1 Tax=Neltuma alba TaxID=207710 RepID=UPI0010A39F33|nr:probable membrane-associated kinase regulator 6 [Prosopis alba]